MGNGSWSADTYASVTRSKLTKGTTFGYSAKAASSSNVADKKAHADLDPKKVNGDASPLAGKNIRESRDSDDHPTSTPVAVWFDETGSMGNTPRVIQEKLSTLFGMLLRKGYLEHPQIMVGGYGDGIWDHAPLQVSQFESDNRVDDALDNLYLEGHGGGNGGESQWLAWYYTAFHTATDAWEKREKKGYAFFIGDEKSLEPSGEQVVKWIGADEAPSGLTDQGIVDSLLEKWEAYVFVINNGSAHNQKSVQYYSSLFGSERVLVVEDEQAIAETISLTIGMTEGVIDLDDGVQDLKDAGASDAAVSQATRALALHKNRTGSLVTGKSPSDIEAADDDSVARL